MGNKFEVHIWIEGINVDFHYEKVYSGESLFQALLVMWKMKRKKVRCVKLYWR
jgi:hypothetical protein